MSALFVTDAQLTRARSDRTYPRKQIIARLMRVVGRHLNVTPDDLLALSKQRNFHVWDAFLADLALATAITDDAKYLDHALEFMRVLPERWRGITFDHDIFVPYVLISLANFEDLARGRLSDTDTGTIRQLITEFAELMWSDIDRRDYSEVERTAWNHSIIVHSGVGVAGLVLTEHPDAEAWLDRGIEWTARFLDVGVTHAGMTWEGLEYCSFDFKAISPLLNGLRNSGREHVLVPPGSEAEQRMHRIPAWYAHSMFPRGGWVEAYNDSRWEPHAVLPGFLRAFAYYEPALCAAVWERLVGVTGKGSLGQHRRWSSIAEAALFLPDADPNADWQHALDDVLFCPDVGYLTARDAWTDEASVFTFNCGVAPCELHDQADNNSFTYIARGTPAVIDTGGSNRCIEGSASSAEGHNLVFVDGRSEHPAGEGILVAGAIVAFERDDRSVRIVGDATESYNFNDYNPVRYAYRHATFVRRPHPFLVVFDDIDKDGLEHDYEFRMHVPQFELVDDARVVRSIDLAGLDGEPAVSVAFANPQPVQLCSAPFGSNHDPFKEHVVITARVRAVKPDFVVLFAPAALGAPVTEVTADEAAVHVRIQWPDVTDDIVFARVRAHV